MKKPAVPSRMRSCPERLRVLPKAPNPLPTWSAVPPRQRERLVAAVCQMVLAHLRGQGAPQEAGDEHAAR
jgi:hypothetical protein